ncbi:ABC transporter substrate-binding protein [Nonomuraea sp. NPDC049709]|uniref:ABC transporter substrate-binding protein n=1 Tax=Nonomuraea sp. NPDC049709 TaxID=3154736 RepID=UPI003433A2C5
MLTRSTMLLVTALLLAGCGADATPQPAAGDVGPKPGGTLVLGENADEPACLDPHQLSTTNTTVVGRPIFDSLLWQDAEGDLKPWLASAWKVSDDGLTYTFTLRDGVTFHDGSAWNAEALKLNLEHMRDPATKSPLAASYIAPYRDAKVVDEHTLQVRLSSPYSAFLNVLAQSYLAMLSPEQLKEAPASTCEHPVGSGPFVFDKWTKGQSITYRKNPGYTWAPTGRTGPAYLDGLEIRFLAEDATRYNALLAGEVNVIDNTPPASDFTAGRGISHDPAKASTLLDEAGWSAKDKDGIRLKDGKRLTAVAIDTGVNPQNTQILVQAQAAAAKAGIEIRIDNVTAQESQDRTGKGDFDVSVGIWTTNTADVLWIQYSSKNITTPERRGQNTTRLADDDLDKLLEEARARTNAAERAGIYGKAQTRLLELAPAIPLYDRPSLVSAQKRVHGLTWDYAYGAVTFHDAWVS